MASRSKGLGTAGRVALFCAIAVAGVLADQALKGAMRSYLADGPKPFLPGVMELRLVENTGAAFSIGQGQTMVFVVIAAAVAVGALAYVWRSPGMPTALACSLAFVASGGLGNLVDRLAKGSVTDFLATTFISFPVFNLADIFVTCGVAVSFVLAVLWDEASEPEEGAAEADAQDGPDA